MAAFIVISTNNRLHYLVDGIEKCRPLNQDISANISTGKITKKDSQYTYQYTIHGEGSKKEGAKSLCNLLSNQLAAFRLAYNIPQDEQVNIFTLENPLNEDELSESESWIEELERVYDSGQGHDTCFCLFRIIFTYNHENPTDIESQTDIKALKHLLCCHKDNVTCGHSTPSEISFNRYLFYIDNQKSDAAALCLYKEEHDIKMPRFLIDFMMLASNTHDSYNVIAAINSIDTVNTRCFSVGFAESMYYYPDVERYYKHADNRDLHGKFLNDPDETQEDVSKKSMNVELFPFGLRARRKRLACIYEDVPFNENIENYPITADYKIDKSIVALKELLINEREKEIEDFMNSSEIISHKKSIANYEEQINKAHQNEKETPEDFDKRIKELCSSKKEKEKELDDLINSFSPDCPEFIDRAEIYARLCVTEEEDLSILSESLSKHYNNLVNFAKNKKFYSYVKTFIANSVEKKSDKQDGDIMQASETNTKLNNNPGCLSWLFPWKSKNLPAQDSFHESTTEKISKDNVNYTDNITCIKEQVDLKNTFKKFKIDISFVEDIYKKEKKVCEDFKLTEHTNHFYPLIDLNKLRTEHSSKSMNRIEITIVDWRGQDSPTKTSLISLVETCAGNYTKTNFPFINWDTPFSFVKDISIKNDLPKICNELQKRAAPFVNYNLTSEFKENKIIRQLYSDRPNFKNEILSIRKKLQNGNEIAASMSTHIVSKICMMQILPMGNDVLENLVDLQEQKDPTLSEVIGKAENISDDI